MEELGGIKAASNEHLNLYRKTIAGRDTMEPGLDDSMTANSPTSDSGDIIHDFGSLSNPGSPSSTPSDIEQVAAPSGLTQSPPQKAICVPAIPISPPRTPVTGCREAITSGLQAAVFGLYLGASGKCVVITFIAGVKLYAGILVAIVACTNFVYTEAVSLALGNLFAIDGTGDGVGNEREKGEDILEIDHLDVWVNGWMVG